MLRHVLTLRQISHRTVGSTSRRYLQNKVPEKQKLFQADNDLPVHLKGGISDALLFRLTMTLSVVELLGPIQRTVAPFLSTQSVNASLTTDRPSKVEENGEFTTSLLGETYTPTGLLYEETTWFMQLAQVATAEGTGYALFALFRAAMPRK